MRDVCRSARTADTNQEKSKGSRKLTKASFEQRIVDDVFSSSRTGVFSSCCLALDSSSSFPCPAFRAIAKSVPALLESCTDSSAMDGDVDV
ncbi:hypothetical protein STEG23_028755 [Scotinomys teguina]